MSQYVSTEEEEMVQVASNRGWSDFCDWGRSLAVEDAPSVHHLIEHGYDNDPDMLLEEIEAAIAAKAPADDVRSTAQGLIDFLHEHQDAEIILISNGMTSDEDGDDGEEEPGPADEEAQRRALWRRLEALREEMREAS